MANSSFFSSSGPTVVEQDAIEGSVNAAEASKNAAATSATAAASSATAAASSASAASSSSSSSTTAKTASVAAQSASETAKTASEAARDLALTYRDAAAASSSTSTTKANESAASATAAANSATASASSASAASTSATNSSNSATAAASSATAAASSAATLTDERIQDITGAMFSGNSEDGASLVYQDSDGTIDFTIGILNQSTSGNASTASALQTARTIHGVSFDGTANIDLSEVVQDTVGAMFTSTNTETGITATYQDSTGDIDLVIGTLNQDTTGLAGTATALATARTIGGTSFNGTANIDVALATLATNVVVTDNESGNNNCALTFVNDLDGAASIGLQSDGNLQYNPSTGTLTVENISVSGTQTVVNSVQMNASNQVVFEGATADAHETFLTSIDATADRTISLPNVSGTLPVLAQVSDTQITSTPEELNILDGVTSTAAELNLLDNASANTVVNSKAVIYGSSGELAGTLSTAAQTNVTSLGTLSSLTVSGDVTVDTNTLKVDSSNNRIGVNNASPDVSLDLGSNTDAVHMPTGNTAQRPGSPAAGYFRYNSETAKFEGYTDEWGAIAGSGGSGSAVETQIFTGDGSDVTFTLTTAPANEQDLIVLIDGVYQDHSTYSLSGNVLTFSTAPANTRKITVYHFVGAVGGSNHSIATMTGNNSTATLNLPTAPVHENNVQIYWDGIYQSKSNWTVSGTTITFSTAPPTGVLVEAILAKATNISTATQLLDADSDTLIQCEESADEDKIRFDTGGTERMVLDSTSLTVTPKIVSDAGIDIDNFNIDGTTIALSSGDMTLDSAGDIILDADGADVIYKDGGTTFLEIDKDGNNARIKNPISDGDIKIQGNDGGSTITAIDIDMSAGGDATFNGNIILSGTSRIRFDHSLIGDDIFDTDSFGIACDHTESIRMGTESSDGSSFTERFRIDNTGSQSQFAGQSLSNNFYLDSGSNQGAFNFTWFTDGASALQSVAHMYVQQGSGDGAARKAEFVFQVSDNGAPATALTIANNGVVSGNLNDTSDVALKENITDLGSATATLKQLQPRTFDWKQASKGTGVAGFVAQEVASVIPKAVVGNDYSEADKNTGKAINTTSILAYAVKTIQELEARIKILEDA